NVNTINIFDSVLIGQQQETESVLQPYTAVPSTLTSKARSELGRNDETLNPRRALRVFTSSQPTTTLSTPGPTSMPIMSAGSMSGPTSMPGLISAESTHARLASQTAPRVAMRIPSSSPGPASRMEISSSGPSTLVGDLRDVANAI